MSQRNDATERQVRAADPGSSTWLSANAGSGKTRVLTDRVARLLFAGTEPQKVLCLTYTKAAAAEMQNRLLKRLGGWAMLDDARLRAELQVLGVEGALDAESLARARRLFAQAIEAPGGLKIQTIHAFCGALLRRFPLEAGVSHGFAELDDRSGERMREEVLEELATSTDRPVFDAFLRAFSGASLGSIISEISQNRDAFAGEFDEATLRQALQIPAGLTLQTLPARVFDAGTPALISEVMAAAKTDKGKTMQKLVAGLAAIDFADPGLPELEALADLVLVKEGTHVRKGLLTKGAAAAAGDALAEAFLDLAEQVLEARQQAIALQALERTQVLHRFAKVLLPRLAAKKAQGGWLDFDDLIERAGALLENPATAQWVLFKLDGGIDHILVDEAQDTSPGQWRVIERLADEFTAGEGARSEARTIFVVGDRKQSIYSFQGADLEHFEAVKTRFSEKFQAVQRPLQDAALLHSFRSSLAILRLVDLTFQGPASEGVGGVPEHLAFHEDLPGRVDLWPVVPKPEKVEPGDWEDPVDLPGAETAPVVLARAVAAEIAAMIAAGVQIPDKDGPRPVHAGDFLVLVQGRQGLFFEIIRACKARGIEVAGADRLRLGGELAVKDILSVLAFLATPEDDLALAGALRSPLFGLGEDALFRLAHGRKGFLWQALRESAQDDVLAVLHDLRDQADFLRPHDLIERLLIRHDGRRKLLARLGSEAEEGIDALIAQALAYERSEVPSLTGFLAWLGAEEVDIKRQLEGAGSALRVMTVHGSKGLEAPIVILPDTAPRKASNRGEILRTEDGTALWKGSFKPLPDALAEAQEAKAARERQERLRLLYVAMTRAEKWLIIALAGDEDESGESWYALMEAGMNSAGTETVSALSPEVQALGDIRRFAHGDWPANGTPAQKAAAQTVALPAWAGERVSAPEAAERPLSASDLGGAKALPGEGALLSQEDALRRGRQLHLLLEHLPQWPEERWDEIAKDLLAFGEDYADHDETETLLREARKVLKAVKAAGFLAGTTLAEVELTADLPELGGPKLHGIVDRLQILPDRVRVLDYKSNAVVPQTADQVPLGLVRQMAAYRGALRQIYPGRAVECLLLWTTTGEIMPLSDTQMDDALALPASS
ncbi:DNA helicase/exodeoxyribonuclease V subunit A [Rhodobacter aestuarii]|uniref:DNA 3'-5' helicase n=1 Tax=Rhodobacter aestuarii TaxID=453582 RepID=A0A1N7LHE0_9RHOB|nr:double-strand break repair helicase AddA [Rhodobacter aestuarii]PTV95251.1 DNA helicase/exodeoxyribonuclease V subunit A [Rhodobacter aestuarii]SIS73255.1 DNA helicase/exodeoxyribonuclease V, subunit A [Rhodobacter aestuarii]